MAETLLIIFFIAIIAGVPIGMALAVGAMGASFFYPAINPIIMNCST